MFYLKHLQYQQTILLLRWITNQTNFLLVNCYDRRVIVIGQVMIEIDGLKTWFFSLHKNQSYNEFKDFISLSSNITHDTRNTGSQWVNCMKYVEIQPNLNFWWHENISSKKSKSQYFLSMKI